MWIDKQTFIDNLNLPNMTMTLTKCQVIRLYCADQGWFNWIPLIARTFNGWSSSPGNFNSGWSVPASHWSPRGLQRQLQLLLLLPKLILLDDQHGLYWMITLITNGTPTTTTTTQWSAPTSHWSPRILKLQLQQLLLLPLLLPFDDQYHFLHRTEHNNELQTHEPAGDDASEIFLTAVFRQTWYVQRWAPVFASNALVWVTKTFFTDIYKYEQL